LLSDVILIAFSFLFPTVWYTTPAYLHFQAPCGQKLLFSLFIIILVQSGMTKLSFL